MSKQEAERLADACDVCASDNSAWRLMREAAAKLRQWPDVEVAAYQYLFEGTYGPVWRNDSALWNGQKPTASRPLYTAPPDQSTRIAELEQEVGAWRHTHNEAHDYHRAAMVELSKILGVEDPESEPRFKWVALQASKVVDRISELERQRDALLEALKVAVLQNTHEMLMTGEDIRLCESAIKAAGGGK